MSWETLTVSGALIVALVLTSLGARAQTESAATTFDVVSVKPDSSGGFRSSFTFSQGRLEGQNVSLPLLIRDAYRVEAFQIKGGLHGSTPTGSTCRHTPKVSLPAKK